MYVLGISEEAQDSFPQVNTRERCQEIRQLGLMYIKVSPLKLEAAKLLH
jgi:hypothetical protein